MIENIIACFKNRYIFSSKYIHTYLYFFLQHSFLDLEHLPSEESHAKALSLIDQAVKLDNENDLEAGIVIAYSNEKFFPYSL